MSDEAKIDNGWHFNKTISLSLIVQLVFLAGLIIGTWVNLQKQLSLLQHDMNTLLENQKQFQSRLERLDDKCLIYDCRIGTIEKQISKFQIQGEFK